MHRPFISRVLFRGGVGWGGHCRDGGLKEVVGCNTQQLSRVALDAKAVDNNGPNS
jgi:hypothetical protein